MGIVQRQSIKSSIVTYIGVAIGYLNFVILYPRFLNTDQVGLIRVLVSAAVILSYATFLGSPSALIRYFPYFRNNEKKHHGFLTLILLITLAGFVIVSGMMLIFREPITELYERKSELFSDNFNLLFPITFFFALAEIPYQYCRSLFKNVIPAIFREIGLRVVQMLAIVLYIFHLADFNTLVLIFISSYLFQLLTLSAYVAWLKEFFFFAPIKLEGIVSLKAITRYSAFMFASSLAAVYNNNADTVMLSVLSGLTDTAVYSIAFFIGTIIQIPSRTMNFIAVAIISEAWKNNDQRKIGELYQQTSLNQFLIGGFIFLLIWINTNLLLSFLPAEYAAAKWVIFVVGIGKLVDMITGINAEILSVSKHVKVNVTTNVFLIVITTASNYFFIREWGIMGAAIATALSLLAYNLIRMSFLFYRYHLQPFTIQTIKALILLASAFGIYYLLPSLGNLWWNSLYMTTILTILFIVPLIYFKISAEINTVFLAGYSFIFKSKA